jgi:hypothetical protein
MTKQITFGNIEFVTYGTRDMFPGKLNPIAAAIRGESEMGGGGGLKGLLGVVVAIAVPFIAPMVATTVFGSSIMAGAISGTLASAATGAVLGAAGAALTGGDVGRGALMGGIGGGFTQGMGGFGSTNNPLFGQATTQNAGFFGPTGTVTNAGQSQTGFFGGPAASGVDDVTNAQLANAQYPNAGASQNLQATNTSNAGNTLSTTNPPQYANVSGSSGAVNPATSAVDGGTYYSGANAGQLPGYVSGGGGVNTGVASTATSGANAVTPAAATDPGYWAALKGRVTDPTKLADMTLMMTPQVIGGIYASQAGKEQQKRIDEYQAELKRLEGQDQAAYQAKLAEYNDFVTQAKAINPEYWAQQASNEAQVRGAKALAEGFRDDRFAGLRSPGYGAAERRRATLGLTANVGSAYDRGYAGGLDMRNQALSRAQSMYPTAPRGMQAGLKELQSMYGELDTSRALAGQGATKMASYMTYPLLSKDTRDIYRG